MKVVHTIDCGHMVCAYHFWQTVLESTHGIFHDVVVCGGATWRGDRQVEPRSTILPLLIVMHNHFFRLHDAFAHEHDLTFVIAHGKEVVVHAINFGPSDISPLDGTLGVEVVFEHKPQVSSSLASRVHHPMVHPVRVITL